MAETVSIKESSPDCWRVTYDGCFLGDDRGHRKDAAWTEAVRRVEREIEYADRNGRERLLVLGEKPE